MDKPKQGRLIQDEQTKEWSFRPGKKETNPLMPLPDLEQRIHQLIANKRIFDGHVRFSHIATARRSRIMADMLATQVLKARHVSAATLENMNSPLLSQHSKLSPHDKEIWDAAYGEEYYGLVNLPCWRTIDKTEY